MSPVALRLSAMMFLQFFIWGAWYVTAPRYLGTIGFAGTDFAWTYSVGPIAGIISPFFVGMIADRFFPTERMLGLLHIAGGALMLAATGLMQQQTPNPDLINLVFLGHMLCFFPTLALTNSISMANLENTETQFPRVRVFGTIGWIIAGFVVGGLQWGGTIDQFYLAGGAAILLGLYSFSLPHTPPPNKGRDVSARELLGADAFVMLNRPAFLVFMACSFLVCIPLAFYYQLAERSVTQAGLAEVEFAGLVLTPPIFMTFGQISEIVFMVLMPLFFVRLGVKWMLAVGMLAWVVRYFLFAIGAPDDIRWMMLLGVVLHGICYDFFFVTGQIYTDKSAPPAIRGQAQGMLVLFTLGLGMLIGAQIAGRVEAAYTPVEKGRLDAESGAAAKLAKSLQEEHDGLPASARAAADEALAEIDTPTDLAAMVDAEARSATAETRVTEANVALEKARAEAADAATIEKLTEARDELLEQKVETAAAASLGALDDQFRAADLDGDAANALSLRLRIAALNRYRDRRALEALNTMDWRMIWMIPAVASAVVLLVFVLAFHDRVRDGDVTDETVARGEARADEGAAPV